LLVDVRRSVWLGLLLQKSSVSGLLTERLLLGSLAVEIPAMSKSICECSGSCSMNGRIAATQEMPWPYVASVMPFL